MTDMYLSDYVYKNLTDPFPFNDNNNFTIYCKFIAVTIWSFLIITGLGGLYILLNNI
jgi:hypothetical protein